MLMFPQIIQALSVSPQAISHLTFYARRLARERVTRKLSITSALLLVVLQLATIIAPADASNTGSTNDIIFGGFSSQQQLVNDCHNGAGGQYSSAAQLQAIYGYFGVTCDDIARGHVATINSVTTAQPLISIGHNQHLASDTQVAIAGMVLWERPLKSWDTGANVTRGSNYQVVEGNRSADGQFFAILFQCGNIVFHSVPAPKPAPVATKPVTPAPPVTTIKTTSPPPVVPPNITQQKSALNVTQATDATAVTAQAGDEIRYTLLTGNSGGSTAKNVAVADNIGDILEYADVVDAGGATLNGSTLSWQPVSIPAGTQVTNRFTIRVKDPVPSTPQSTSDPKSFDLHMDNVYGNLISIIVAAPPAKQIEVASAALPQTGAGTTTVIILIVAAIIAYFYYRNKQLLTEIKILRGDYQGGGY